MLTPTKVTSGERLLSYVVAGAGMRYIEVNERMICLQDDPELGLILRGSVPECGPGCDIGLSEILLEFSMSCEDCRDKATTARHIDHFGQILGSRLIFKLDRPAPEMTALERLSEVMNIVLNSMDAEFHKDITADQLRYTLANCPISEAARDSGLSIWAASARSAFVTLCSRVIDLVAPDFRLVQPAKAQTEAPLEEIVIARA